MVGLCRHDADRNDGPVVHKLDAERCDHSGKRQCSLGDRELRADAHARPHAERQIGEAIRRRRAGQETLRTKFLRIVPEPGVAVQKPRRDQDDILRFDIMAGNAIGARGGARNQEYRRIEAQHLVEHGAGELQLVQRRSVTCLERFGSDALLGFGIEQQHVSDQNKAVAVVSWPAKIMVET